MPKRRSAAQCAVAGLAVLWLFAAPARGESPPADCSAEPAPDGALVLEIGERSTPLPVARFRSQQKMSFGDEAFEVFGFSLRDAESIFPPHLVEVSVLVKQGEAPDGKTFRRLAVAEQKEQPTPASGDGLWLPEVQSVEVKSEADGIAYQFGVLSSVRIELGKRRGDVLPGRIRLCIAPGQQDPTFQTEPTKAVLLEGAFEAELGL